VLPSVLVTVVADFTEGNASAGAQTHRRLSVASLTEGRASQGLLAMNPRCAEDVLGETDRTEDWGW